MPRLTTPRLELIPITLDAIEAVIAGDKARAERAVGAAFPEAWPNEDLIARAFPVSLDAIRADPVTRLWGDTLVLLRDESPARVVGSVVFLLLARPGARGRGDLRLRRLGAGP